MVAPSLHRVCAILLLVCAGPALARQVGPLIGDLVEYADVRAVIPSDTTEAFARAVDASAEQRAAAGELVEGARTEVARVVNRHLRTVRDDPTLEQIKESEARVLRDAREVERQLMDDLASLVTGEQQPRFESFERAHRRSLLRLAKPQPLPLDLWKFFAANKFDAAKDEGLRDLLDKFDRESDVVLVRERRARKEYLVIVRRGVDGSNEAMARERAALRELLEAGAARDRVFAAMVEPLLRLLPKELGDRLALEIIRLATEDYDKNLAEPAQYPIVREVLALSLTPGQRRDARTLIDAAKGDALAQARSTAVEQARYTLLDDKVRTDGRTSPLNLYLESASKLRVRVSNQLLTMLTPEQRRAYDASDVVEPSTTSIVNEK